MQRAIQWAIYSNNMPFLDLPMEKLKNKVICDLHFSEVSFMNTKREKLNKTTAIPTIYINSNDYKETDMLVEPMPWIEENKRKQIPSSFSSKIDIEDSSDSIKIEAVETLPKVTQGIKRKAEPLQSPTTVKILNTRVLNAYAPNRESSTPLQRLKKLPTAPVTKVLSESYTIHRVPSTPQPKPSPVVTKQEIIQPANQFDVYDVSDLPVQFSSIESDTEIQMQSPPRPPVDDLKPILLDSLKQIAELKKIMQEKKPPEASPQVKAETSNISQSHLNKVQLFNGIKRYLSPAMNALLRIELFSNPSREYKKDEKIICQELLDLGEPTYDFLTDEWRLRLPAKNEVEQWKLGNSTEDEEDAC